MGSVQQGRRDVVDWVTLRWHCLAHRHQCGLKEHLRCLCISREKARQASMPMFLGSDIPMQKSSISQSSPILLHVDWPHGWVEQAALTGWHFTQGDHERAAVSTKDQVLSVQLDEEQKRRDGTSFFDPGVHLSGFFRLLGWEMAEITEGHSPVS